MEKTSFANQTILKGAETFIGYPNTEGTCRVNSIFRGCIHNKHQKSEDSTYFAMFTPWTRKPESLGYAVAFSFSNLFLTKVQGVFGFSE